MDVIILRGLPGSGKSTWIKNTPDYRSRNYIICSADDFHIGEDGVYRFDPMNIGAAHAACLRKFLRAIEDYGGVDDSWTVFVDNTNLAVWEIAPYYRIAAEGYALPTRIVRIHCTYEQAVARNVHQVPAEKIWQMYQTLLTERLPSWWKEEIVILAGDTVHERTKRALT